MAQGIARDKEQTIEALRPYFQLGYSVTKACELAKIPQSTVATWISDDEELRLKITAWQGMVSAQARANVVKAIRGESAPDGTVIVEPDLKLSQWWLETKDRDEFKKGLEVDGVLRLEKLIDDILNEDTEDSETN